MKRFRISSIFLFLVSAALSFPADAQNECAGTRLSKSNYFKNEGAACGKLKGRWIAGSMRKGLFVPSSCAIESVKVSLAQSSDARTRKALKKKLALIQARYSREKKICKSGRPIPSPNSFGSIQLSQDASTIAFDNTFDVLKAVAKGSTRRGAAIRGLNDEVDVPGRKDGKALVSGTYTGDEKTGVIDFQGFLNRLGFPMFESGAVLYDLALSPTSVSGTLSASHLRISVQGDIRQVSFATTYTLVLENGIWGGGVTGTITVDGEEKEVDINYDKPILLAAEAIPLNANGDEVPGTSIDAGSKVRVRLWVNSNAPVNWVNSSWESPSKNLEGGGSGQSYCRYGACPELPGEWTFAEADVGYWLWYRDYTINKFQEAGEYSWSMSVRNAAELTSRTLRTAIQVQNPDYKGEKPKIEEISLATSGISSGRGASSTITILAQSSSPVNWLNRSFEGPTENIYGGGSSFSFQSCDQHVGSVGHICFGRDSTYYFTSFTDTISRWAPNGLYSYRGLSVENEAQLRSDPYTGDLSFTVSNNPVAVTPGITSIEIVSYNEGENPIIAGEPLNGVCKVASRVSDPFRIAVIITATSNAPVSWLNSSFYGPLGNLFGGGSGVSFTQISSGVWRYVMTTSISSPLYAPKGTYYFQNISVQNDGRNTSSAYSGSLSFQLRNSCP